jgi:hypothetical protein
VAYQPAQGPDVRLHAWNANQWVAVTVDQYRNEIFRGRGIQQVVIVGEKEQVPFSLVSDSSWCPNVHVLETLDVAALVPELDPLLSFTPSEWKWLADRHGLKIMDINAERRRYGRYGKPGAPKPLPPPPVTPSAAGGAVLPPAEPAAASPEPARVEAPAPAPVPSEAKSAAPAAAPVPTPAPAVETPPAAPAPAAKPAEVEPAKPAAEKPSTEPAAPAPAKTP